MKKAFTILAAFLLQGQTLPKEILGDHKTMHQAENCQRQEMVLAKDFYSELGFNRVIYKADLKAQEPLSVVPLGPAYSINEAMSILHLEKQEHLDLLVSINNGFKCISLSEVQDFANGGIKSVNKRHNPTQEKKSQGQQ